MSLPNGGPNRSDRAAPTAFSVGCTSESTQPTIDGSGSISAVKTKDCPVSGSSTNYRPAMTRIMDLSAVGGLVTEPVIRSGPHACLRLSNGHGCCVSFNSWDALDSAAVEHCAALVGQGKYVSTLELGSSPYIPQSIRFARLGADAYANDLLPMADSIQDRLTGPIPRVTFLQGDMADEVPELQRQGRRFSVVTATRCLSHLPFERAVSTLRAVKGCLTKDGMVFASLSSLRSTLADGYAHAGRPLRTRFTSALNPRADQAGLTAKLCLYEPEEVPEVVKAAGLTIERRFTSKLGTIKLILSS